jgi:hypothetical protein
VGNDTVKMGYTVEDGLSRSQLHSKTRLSVLSDVTAASTYSQNEDGRDKLAPLMSVPSINTLPGKHAMRVTSAVAELRRMNSQISCVSGSSTATGTTTCDTEIASPALPALRGGGFSPGKKGTGGGAKNYLALGNPSNKREGEGEDGGVKARRDDAIGTGRNINGKNGKETATGESIAKALKGGDGSKAARDEIALRKGSVGRSRRHSVVESFEQDLDRVRQVLRESRGYNLQAIQEVSKSVATGGLMTHAAKLEQEEGRGSLGSPALYDEKGFLKESVGEK